MRVAFCCPEFFSQHGGAQQHCRRLAEEFAALGHDVTVVADAPRTTRMLRADSECSNPKNRQMSTSRLCECFYRLLKWLRNRRGGWFLIRILFSRSDFTVVSNGPHCSQLSSPGFFAEYDAVVLLLSGACSWGNHLGRALRKTGIVSVALPLFHVRMDSYDWSFQKRVHDRFSHVVTNTLYEKQFLVDKGWRSDHLTSVGVGSDISLCKGNGLAFRKKYGIPEGEPIVLFLGRKNFYKGITHLVEGMDRVWSKNPMVRLVLIGFSHNKREWLDGYFAKSQYGAKERTIDLYDVCEQEREDALAAATMMVLPSINDSFGIAYLDAWRHGVPVVGCRDTCCEDFISEGVDGLLVPFGSVEAIGTAVNHLLGDDELCHSMGKRGYDKWRTLYTWSIMAGKLDVLLRNLMVQKQEAHAGR